MQTKLILLLIILVLLGGGFLFYQKTNSDEYQINSAIKEKLSTNDAVKSFTVSDLRVKDSFARAKVIAPGLDPAGIVLEKKDGKWQVIWGPATGTGTDDPILKIVPKDL